MKTANVEELRVNLGHAITEADNIRSKYEGKSEGMTGEEERQFEEWMNEADGIAKQLELIEKEQKAKSVAKRFDDMNKATGTWLPFPNAGGISPEEQSKKLAERKAYSNYLQGQDPASRFAPEMKAYQSGDTLSGGSFITPVEMANEIITLMKDLVFMRQLSRHFTVTQAGSLGFPTIDTDPSDTDWTAELAIGNEETTLTTGRRELKPSALAKSLKLSKKLLRMVPNFESVIMDRLAYKVGITQEKAFLAGDGSNKPLGVFTASPQGISTNRDNVAANAASIVADDLWNTYFKLKAQYRAKATWIINRTVLQAVRKLKDANNNYIWATGIGPGLGYQGLPATLLGLPYCESEYAPGTIATGLYTAILGDFSHYYIADALSMEIQVLYELYAANNQMGYILRLETDGMPVLEEAFARLKQA